MDSKLIVVLGATGNQGGSVVNTFLQDLKWRVRGITRNTSSSKATALAAKGVEVVQANMDDTASLTTAFDGASVIFAVSDFWGIYSDPANSDRPAPGQALNAWTAEQETQQLKNVIDAAARVSTLERFVLSSLSNATKWSKGKYTKVYHFDSKANAEAYGKETYPDLWAKTSVFYAGFFLSSLFEEHLRPVKLPNNTIQIPGHLDASVKLPFIAPEEDSGPIIKALIAEPPQKLIGYREWLTMEEVASLCEAATGLSTTYAQVPRGEWPPMMPGDIKEELEENFAYWNEFGYEGREDGDVRHPGELRNPPKLGSVLEYLRKQDWSGVLGS